MKRIEIRNLWKNVLQPVQGRYFSVGYFTDLTNQCDDTWVELLECGTWAIAEERRKELQAEPCYAGDETGWTQQEMYADLSDGSVVSALLVWYDRRYQQERWISVELLGERADRPCERMAEVVNSPMCGWRSEPSLCLAEKTLQGGGVSDGRSWPSISIGGPMRVDESCEVWPMVYAVLGERYYP